MKKIILAVFVMALMVSCEKKEKVNYALISGKIENTKASKIEIRKAGAEWKTIPLSKDGSFRDTIFDANGYYWFYIPEEKIMEMYLEKGFDIQMTLDVNQSSEAINFKGKGNEINNYLANFDLKGKEVLFLFALEENTFLDKLNSFIEQRKKELKGLDENFVKKQKRALDYYRVMRLRDYKIKHGRMTGNRHFKVSDKFPNPLESIDLRNDKDFDEFSNYQRIVKYAFDENVNKEAARSGKEYYKVALEKIRKMKEGSIRNSLLADMVSMISGTDAKRKEIHDAIMELSTDEVLKNKLKKLVKGNPSPTFENYENYKGGKTSLKDFKGKFVYIDVWATWCGPCKYEIPFMKKLEEKYHGKDIVFVSISVDDGLRSKESWQKMVKNKEMIGVQLFADKSWKSDFIKSYDINSIPRFIFLDKKGNIIDANAPRPSDPKLIELFKEYGL